MSKAHYPPDEDIYPNVSFVLRQGDHTGIGNWVQNGSVDFGFVNADTVSDFPVEVLFQDEMRAVLPQGHYLAKYKAIHLWQLAREPVILLDEGLCSVLIHAFQQEVSTPQIEYEVFDDYTILAMVRQGLGISALYQLVLEGYEDGIEIRPIEEHPRRSVALAWKNWDTMSFSSRRFVEFILKHFKQK